MGLLRESSTRDNQVLLLYSSLACLFVLLYLILFPRALPPEFTLVPESASVLADRKADRLTPGGSYFLLGSREGYWSPEGSLEQVQPRRPLAAVSGDRLAWYDASQDRLVVESPSGTLFTVAGESFPFWKDGQLFTMEENRLGLTAVGSQGRQLWKKQFSSLVTSVDTTGRLTVVGTLDGRVQVFGPDGAVSGGFQPGGSRLPVVYNVALAPDDGAILVLAGVDPKRFLVLERGGADFRPIFHKPLKEASPWPTPLGFLNNGALAYYENDRGLAVLDPRSPDHEVVIASQGKPLVVEALPGGHLLAFVERSSDRTSLRVASITGVSLLTLPFAFQDLLLQSQGNTLFLGVDQTLLRMEVRVQ